MRVVGLVDIDVDDAHESAGSTRRPIADITSQIVGTDESARSPGDRVDSTNAGVPPADQAVATASYAVADIEALTAELSDAIEQLRRRISSSRGVSQPRTS